MKARSIKLGSTLALVLIASASFLASAATGGYKMVLIEDTPGVTALQTGLLEQGITETLTSDAATDSFSRQMNLCVGFTRNGQLQQAEEACNNAIVQVRKLPNVTGTEKRELRAYALSNRGVMHLQNNDNLSALADFKRAAELNNSDINQHNLHRLEHALNSADSGIAIAALSAE